MSTSRSGQFVSFLLVLGAVFFGMVLAGGLEMTVPSMSDPAPTPSPVEVPASSPVEGLPSFADLAEVVEPAVVSISAATIQSAPPRGRGIDPFEFFFGPRRQRPQQEEEEQRRFRSDSGGSGFVISPDGLIVTNNHVIEGADQLEVTLNGRDYPAEVKGADPATDLALVKVDAGDELDYLKLGDSDSLRVGDWVMAIGSPLRLDHSVTVGVVSAKGRSLGIADISFENFIQTDAAINFGNSGGPLVNIHGEVVGIATAINYGAENIGFAVPVATLKQILPQLKETGRVERGYLGIEIANLDYEMAQAFGLDEARGALVGNVTEDSPAEEAGLKHGDIILKVDEVAVNDTRDLINYVSNKGPGVEVTLEILRDGDQISEEVTLAERPSFGAEPQVEEEPGESGIDWLGLEYQNLTRGVRESHGIPANAEGIWVTNVAPDSPLYDEGVRAGDVISEVNGQPVSGVAAFEEIVGAAESGTWLRLYVETHNPQLPRPQYTFAIVRVP